ncbi:MULTISPECIES: DUF1292 domain-containing protein [Clostridium]|uniref:UPF0473 protein G3M99_03025 n=1 Tax=Clostridium senegalense TaxID=1465809 RepID=A0A6M0H179_9CLOT|nr:MULTISPECIES: DUF1292 domain-containing protein [Clostridium]MBU5225651.1 DUF1292 domain-containing protein [Clostridium senegalense]NEU03843.1 DUF1292 domain-containing protein [Clostridium senegalense]
MENKMETIMLMDENGNEIEFEIVVKLDIEDKEYVIVTPVESDEEYDVALRIEESEDGELVLVPVEEDDELALISEAYEALELE